LEVIRVTLVEPITRRWSLEEYYRLAEQGWFEGQRVLLLRGEIIQMPPQGHFHVTSVLKIQRTLHALFEKTHHIRIQMPLNIGTDTDPEPDIALVRGRIEDYCGHPTSADLVVEVSDSTVTLDRRKAGLYAGAGIAEYWIANLSEQRLEVYRSPLADSSLEFGYRYGDVKKLARAEEVSPLARPEVRISVIDLLA
jgi:Uma2 family endonuclease